MEGDDGWGSQSFQGCPIVLGESPGRRVLDVKYARDTALVDQGDRNLATCVWIYFLVKICRTKFVGSNPNPFLLVPDVFSKDGSSGPCGQADDALVNRLRLDGRPGKNSPSR